MENQAKCLSGLVKIGLVAGVLGFSLTFSSIADAAQGCGHGLHRNGWGRCVLNYPGPYARPAPYHPGCWRNRWGQLRCYRY